jgi:hypothetical protein
MNSARYDIPTNILNIRTGAVHLIGEFIIVYFIAATTTAVLPHRKPASEGTSLDGCGSQDRYKRNAFYYSPNRV